MSPDKLLVIVGAVLFIWFIAWWFFIKHKIDEPVVATLDGGRQKIDVTIDGGYTPNTVIFKQGLPASMIFNRKDPSNCFEEVMFPGFGIREKLSVNKPQIINIDTSKSGEYRYVCGMNMFHGKVIIRK